VQKIDSKKLDRVIDANFNRAKEGLRVCEDVFRFVYDEKVLTRKYKLVRHRLTHAIEGLRIKDIIKSRDISKDVGRTSIPGELKRKGVLDIFYANSQRAKESIRVLEEFTKILNVKVSKELKGIRYKVYALEKESLKEL